MLPEITEHYFDYISYRNNIIAPARDFDMGPPLDTMTIFIIPDHDRKPLYCVSSARRAIL